MFRVFDRPAVAEHDLPTRIQLEQHDELRANRADEVSDGRFAV